METNLISLLDSLNVNEVDELLDKNIDCKMDSKTLSRIKALTYQKIGQKSKKQVSGWLRQLAAVSAAACLLLTAGGVSGYAYYKAPVAYLDIDINPSIELGINRWDRIVSAKGYNEDGINVLKAKNVLNKKLQEGVKSIIETADEKGYLEQAEGAAVAITSVTDDTNKAEELTDLSKETIEEYAEEKKLDVEVVTEHVTLSRQEEAKQLGITPGKLNLIQKLQAFDQEIAAEDYKDASVKEIMKAVKALRKEQKANQKEKEKQTEEESGDIEASEEEKGVDAEEDKRAEEVNASEAQVKEEEASEAKKAAQQKGQAEVKRNKASETGSQKNQSAAKKEIKDTVAPLPKQNEKKNENAGSNENSKKSTGKEKIGSSQKNKK